LSAPGDEVIRAVVFDCDGVLVDSEPHSQAAWLAVLGPLEHPATVSDIAACTGLGFLPTREHLADLGPLPPAEELWPLLMDALRASFEEGLLTFDDAIGAVEELSLRGVPLGVASASPRERLDLTLQFAGISGRFNVTVAGDEVVNGKPAPDVYLAVARDLRVDPTQCLAIEDSGPGAAAAVRAGMRVVGVARKPEEAGPLLAAGAALVDRIDGLVLAALVG
jgi:beta-phosphoglucomutase-like phosphatase (HAD superfamily)